MNDRLQMVEKERLARDLAHALTEQPDTDVTPEQVNRWQDFDVYEWVQMWEFEWNGQRWVGPGDQRVIYRAPGHAEWDEGETPICTYCLQAAAFYTHIHDILLCYRPKCHTEFVTTECTEIEVALTTKDEDNHRNRPDRTAPLNRGSQTGFHRPSRL